jgi:hypothetical protein
MALWTDIVDPATLTGYARQSLADYEAGRGTLARWLPNRTIPDIVARFVRGATGLVDVAKFRAYDAEPEIGRRPAGARVTIELPAISQNIPVGEYEQIRARSGNVGDAQALVSIQNTTDLTVRAIADRIELQRGTVLTTGLATIAQDNFTVSDDFGRPAGQTITAPALWSVAGTDRLGQLQTWSDLLVDANGEPPGCMVMSTRVFRSLAAGTQFQTQLLNGGARNATPDEARRTIEAAGLPDIIVMDRRVSVDGVLQPVIPNDRVLLLPAPTDVNNDGGTQLGATFWGRTLAATEPGWGIEDGAQPGIVSAVFRNDRPPMITEVISDAIGMPVLANAGLSFCAKVL